MQDFLNSIPFVVRVLVAWGGSSRSVDRLFLPSLSRSTTFQQSANKIFFPLTDKRKLLAAFEDADIQSVINLADRRGSSQKDPAYVARRRVQPWFLCPTSEMLTSSVSAIQERRRLWPPLDHRLEARAALGRDSRLHDPARRTREVPGGCH